MRKAKTTTSSINSLIKPDRKAVIFDSITTYEMPPPTYSQIDEYLHDNKWEVCWFDDIYARFCLPGEYEDYSHIEGPYQPWKNSIVLIINDNKSKEALLLMSSAIEVIAKIENRPAIMVYRGIIKYKASGLLTNDKTKDSITEGNKNG